MAKDPTLFTFLNQIQNKRRTVPYDKKIANAYMLTQFLSHNNELIGKVNKINKYQFILPDEVVYEYYMNAIPQGKRYLKWIKKRKDDDKMKIRIEKLQENNPNLSKRECKMIISFLKGKKRRNK
jgi:hypothetical protein